MRGGFACFLLAGLAAIVGCDGREESEKTQAPEEIVIGEYSSLSGPTATFGVAVDNAVRLAVGQVNEAGGIDGRLVTLYVEDTQSKPQDAANAVAKLIAQKNVLAIIGEVASSRTLAAAPIAQANEVPMISPASTNPRVTEVGSYIFRVNYIDPFQGKALADFVYEKLALKRAAILRDIKNDYSVGLADYFVKRFEERGGSVVIDRGYSEGDSDFRPQLTAIREVAPDLIFIPGYYTEAGQIARQARELGVKAVLVGGDGWESPRLIEIAGKALEGAYYSNSFYPGDKRPKAQEFVKLYQETYGELPDALAALGYDAAQLLFDAIRRAPEITRRDIRDAIANTTRFEGVTGVITIGPDRNAIKPIVMLKIANGEVVLAGRVSPGGVILGPDEQIPADRIPESESDPN